LRILILGHSTIARKRLIPALSSLPRIKGIEVASRSGSDIMFSDYESALAESSADIVYISLMNSDHARWAKQSLESGRHVVVDKPAFLDFDQAQRVVELSRDRGLCLAEATVYAKHPQIDRIRELFENSNTEPRSLTASFSFPPLESQNFRYRKARGGGALNDLGPYATSPGRIFFGGRPDDLECRVLSRGGPDGVDTAFSVMMSYAGGRSMIGRFGFTTAYSNRLCCLGSELSVDVNRVFTTPGSMENTLHVTQGGVDSTINVPAADCFAAFMNEVLDNIEAGEFERQRNELLEDAFVLDWMRRSAGGR
jgi:NDP-hexose-3-ketoreductase